MSADNLFLNQLLNFPMEIQESETIGIDFPMNEPSPAIVGASGTVLCEIRQPYLEIIEQPASKELRFRYACEIKDGRSAGSLPGVRSIPDRKTFPTVRIVGYVGPVVIIVSCVTMDEPFRAHPHKLVGKEGCKDGICTVRIDVDDNMTKTFTNLGIQCVTKREIRESLAVREKKFIDPFKCGFNHSNEASSINLNAVRLCFQAFLPGTIDNEWHPLTPVVSEVIFDKKNLSDLMIIKLSHCSAPALSRQEVILLCEKVVKEDIQIYFFEKKGDQIVWDGTGEFTPTQVHKQYSIWFLTPKYTKIPKLDQSVTVFIQLRRPSDGAVSEALPFKFTPEVNQRPLLPTIIPITVPQHPQLPIIGSSMRPDFAHLFPPPPYQPPIPDSFVGSLPSISSSQNPSGLPNPRPAYRVPPGEPTLPRTEPQSLVADEPEETFSSSELFPPNPNITDPAIIDEWMRSNSMSQDIKFPNNAEPTAASNMSDSLTNFVNTTFDQEFR